LPAITYLVLYTNGLDGFPPLAPRLAGVIFGPPAYTLSKRPWEFHGRRSFPRGDFMNVELQYCTM